jgi:hypothetical protein
MQVFTYEAFVEELQASLGTSVESSFVSFQSGSRVGAAAPKPERGSTIESVDQMKDKVFQAGKLGFVVDAFVVKKKVDGDCKLYQIKSMTPDAATAVEVAVDKVATSLETISIPIDDFFTIWRLRRGRVTEKLPGWRECASPLSSNQWAFEQYKGAATVALRDATQEYPTPGCIDLYQLPLGVRVTENCPKNSICFVPAS